MPNTFEQGLHAVEILHVDTAGSRFLYSACKANPKDKHDCQKLLRDKFSECCESRGGVVRDWAGDGGFAIFASSQAVGKSIEAATSFLEHLSSLNAQTALRLEANSFSRAVRIKAHRGEVYIAADGGLDSADPSDFDDFLKAEKRFAPETDELFVTGSFYDSLPASDKKRFEVYKKHVKAGALSTPLYRLKAQPKPRARDIFQQGDEPTEITRDEWEHLRNHIFANEANVAARNLITKGLIESIHAGETTQVTASMLLELTLTALYNYLSEIFGQHNNRRFRVSYWRAVEERGTLCLVRVSYRYPEGEEPTTGRRRLPMDQRQYQVIRAYWRVRPIATPSVVGARLSGTWVDFDENQKKDERHLASALQIPVYCRLGVERVKKPVGVLTLDCDRPDTFLVEEADMWQNDLVGFLVNIALAERVRLGRRGV